VTTEIDTPATALYAVTGDLLKESPQFAPRRPAVGLSPQLSDAELVTLAVMQALLGFTSEAGWIRDARAHLRHLFPCLPQQSGYIKRLRAARGLIRHCAGALAASTSLWSDDVWVVDSTPVECARSRETVRRSDLAGWPSTGTAPRTPATSGGCGCTWSAPCTACRSGSPWPAARQTSGRSCWASSPTAACPGQLIIGDKNYYGRDFENELALARLTLLRPARKGEPEPAGQQYFKPLRQVIESVNDTLKGQLDLERHGGRTVEGVTVRVLPRILALTAAIWNNDAAGQPVMRSLVTYDH
jgi:hypothetical protein